jgi:hypothetical protein
MAFRTKKISQMDPKGANLASTDLLEISQLVSGSYVTKSITGAQIAASAPAASWGTITGTLSSQTDLNTALSGKQATVTLTTTGTSGASTFVANTLNVPTYSLSGLGGVPTSRTLTINGTTQDLSADRTFTISTGITIGTTAITSGTVGRVLFEGTGNVVSESANLFWDNTNGRLGIGTSSPIQKLDVVGTARFTTATINGTNGTITIDQVAGGNYLYSLNSTSSAWRDFTIQTNGVDVLNVLSTGRVTLGTKTSATNTLLTLNSGSLNAIESSGNVSFKTCNTFFVEGTNRLAIGSSGVQNEIASVAQNASGWKNLAFQTNGTTATLFTTGNFAINTTTDAGFKLDVNGTARVNNDFTIGSNRYLKAYRWTQDIATLPLQLESNSNYNVDSVNVISLNNNLLNNTKNLINIGLASTVQTQSSSSNDAFNSIYIQTAYNFPSGTHTVKGIYYNPTLTSMVNTTHYAFHSTSGRHRYENLPTSPTGLASGDLWNNLGVLQIV